MFTVTHENFNLKLGTRDYVVGLHHATLGSDRSSGGFFQMGEI